MLRGIETQPAAAVLLNYTDPAGPRITHVRGTLITGSRAGLQAIGVYEQYVELLPPAHKDALLYYVPGSWISLAETLTHFETCDALGLKQGQIDQIGAALAERLAKTFLSAALRAGRSIGVDGYVLWALTRIDKLLQRVYQGGGCAVLQHGPKDVVLELRGNPFARSPYYRGVLLAQTRSVMSLFAQSMFVRAIRPRVSHAESLALLMSWV